jgi:pimeloyl-ACP methyl ester carboxylesterase
VLLQRTSKVLIRGSGHWLMKEQPQATVAVILDFLR